MTFQYQPQNTKITFSSPLRYRKNLFVLILAFFFWFPIGCLLMIKNGYFLKDSDAFYLRYHGNWVWPFLWALVFFPIAFVLMFIKGFDLIQEPVNYFQNKQNS